MVLPRAGHEVVSVRIDLRCRLVFVVLGHQLRNVAPYGEAESGTDQCAALPPSHWNLVLVLSSPSLISFLDHGALLGVVPSSSPQLAALRASAPPRS